MNHGDPPRIATWILEHLRPAGCDEALVGDLLEEFRSGRSAGWYWLQIIAALAVEWSHSAWQHRTSLVFAAAWSVVSPAWVLFDFRFRDLLWHTSFIWYIPPLPWRLIFFLVLDLLWATLLIWLGALAYVMFYRLIFGRLHFRRLALGILWGSTVHFVVVVALLSPIFLLAHPQFTRGPDWRTMQTLTPLGVVEDFRIWTIVVRVPYFLGTAGALWYLTSTELNPLLRGWSAARSCVRGLLIGISRLRRWPSA